MADIDAAMTVVLFIALAAIKFFDRTQPKCGFRRRRGRAPSKRPPGSVADFVTGIKAGVLRGPRALQCRDRGVDALDVSELPLFRLEFPRSVGGLARLGANEVCRRDWDRSVPRDFI